MKSILMDGLLKQGIDSSAVQSAMWENMTMWQLAYQKASSIYTKEDEVSSMIEEGRKTLISDFRRKPLALEGMILMSICEHLKMDKLTVNTIGDLDDLGLEIENKSIELQRKISKKKFTGKSIHELIQYNLKKMFDDLSTGFKKKDENEQKDIIKRIMDVLEEMPDEQKEILRKELNIDSITEKTISKALTTGALGVAFVALIDIAGFSAFTFATQTLAAIVGVVGITLPFSVYVSLTSMMAALANPFLIIPTTVGLGYFMTKQGDRTIRDHLLPTIITQITISSTKRGTTEKKPEQLVRRLKKLNRESDKLDLYNKSKDWLSNLKLGKNK